MGLCLRLVRHSVFDASCHHASEVSGNHRIEHRRAVCVKAQVEVAISRLRWHGERREPAVRDAGLEELAARFHPSVSTAADVTCEPEERCDPPLLLPGPIRSSAKAEEFLLPFAVRQFVAMPSSAPVTLQWLSPRRASSLATIVHPLGR